MRRPGPVPSALTSLADAQAGLVSAAQCATHGVSPNRRAALVRVGAWRRVTRAVYDTAPTADVPLDGLRLRAAWLGLLAFGPGAAAVGPCALALHGVHGLPPSIEPQVALAGGRRGRHRDDIRVRRYEAPHERAGHARSVPLPVALAQALCELPRRHVVAVLDDVLHRELLDGAATHDFVTALAGRRGCRRVRTWSALADPRSESPLESFARLACVDGGVPPDDLQVQVRDSEGRVVARGDLGWRLPRGRWLLAEIDGREFHDVPPALLHDRQRQNALVAARRVDVLRFAAEDVARGVVVRTVRAVLGPTWRPSPVPRTGVVPLLESLARS